MKKTKTNIKKAVKKQPEITDIIEMDDRNGRKNLSDDVC